MNILTTKKLSEVEIEITATFNHKYMGRFLMAIDGYFYYQADTSNPSGYWSQELLKELATLLEVINKSHNARVTAFFKPIHNEDFPIM